MRNKRNNQRGFSYIDVMIAIVIMMVGILAMLSALTANLMRSLEAEKKVIAKQMALSTIESVISAKEIQRIGVIDGWDSVRNTNAIPAGGIFMTGANPIREEMGWDGVAGTIDDACAEGGPCVVGGRPDNNSAVINGYSREIVITDVADPERPAPQYPIARRRIDVHINYFVNQAVRRETVSTILTKYEVLD